MSKQRDVLAYISPDEEKEPQALTRELERVEEKNLEFYEAFSNKDIDRMSNVWSKSPYARCVHPGWELVVGWNDIRQSWTEIFKTVELIDFALEDIHVEVSGRTAWVNLVAFVDVTTDDGDNFQASVVTTNIFEKTDDNWTLVLHHSSNFAEEDEEEEETTEFDMGGRGNSGISDPN